MEALLELKTVDELLTIRQDSDDMALKDKIDDEIAIRYERWEKARNA